MAALERAGLELNQAHAPWQDSVDRWLRDEVKPQRGAWERAEISPARGNSTNAVLHGGQRWVHSGVRRCANAYRA